MLFRRLLRCLLASLMVIPMALVAGATDPAGASRTTSGTDFWLAFGQNLTPSGQRLFLTGSTATTATVSIASLSFSETVSITPGTVSTVEVPTAVQVGGTEGTTDEGIRITAGEPITVYGANVAQYSSDAFVGLPVASLGNRYRVLSYAASSGSLPSRLTVVGTVDGTTVTITPASTLAGGRTANTPYTVTLNAGQTYTVTSSSSSSNSAVIGNHDVTGTVVESTQPVSVFASVDCVNIIAGACDHIVEQLPPTEAWGTNFLAVRFPKASGGDRFRIIADQDDTEVRAEGNLLATLDAGEFLQTTLPTGSPTGAQGVLITTSKPAMVMQYMEGGTTYSDGTVTRSGDPAMLLIPPYEQFQAAYTFATPAVGFELHAINVMAPTSSTGSILLDGVPMVATWNPIAGTTFSAAQVWTTAGTHTITGSLPFGLAVSGYNDFNSYAYAGGYSVSQVASVTELDLGGITEVPGLTGGDSDDSCFDLTVKNTNGDPVEGVRVDAEVTGANPQTTFAVSDADGIAEVCLTGTDPGTSTINLNVGGVTSTLTMTWASTAPSTTVPAPTTTTTEPPAPTTVPAPTTTVPTAPTTTVPVARSAALPSGDPVAVEGPALRSVPVDAPTGATIIGLGITPSGSGSWSLDSRGTVRTAGDATFHGSPDNLGLKAPAAGLAPMPDGGGYYVVAEDGGVFAYGDAPFKGSAADIPLAAPVRAIAPSCAGNGYYLAAEDGGVFTYGDAQFHGSMAGTRLNDGVIGIAPLCTGDGYYLFARDGGVFAFGEAQFHGSLANNIPPGGVVALVPTTTGNGYWLVGGDRSVTPFGDARSPIISGAGAYALSYGATGMPA
jgi:hypothetical protein